ncbi:IucA/IucC family protein [Cellulomonas bogoriensis]|uniref:IucA/IucC family protein n=1 Tax=Cellulomonas bogoriensis 69B4 = DSM 16987 TaxID=1386082 RepID=A0A0A0BY34_9CELL|nr:IucA/IucC family siderophore biosynthesis protein [Cellulomonas bogoriensis]KGM12602.1 IucA/IucC family protein [Cellulomonas bogoriensis 69B4 = DSM 16987]
MTTLTLPQADPAPPLAHLDPLRMDRAHRAQVAKTLAELTHEQLLTPRPDGDAGGARWVLHGDDPRVVWRMRARVLPLDHWVVDPDSLTREVDGRPAPVDAQQLVLDVRRTIGLDARVLPTYLEEVAATLAGRAWKLRPDAPSARDLLDADLQATEAAMTEGHPCFVANNGRVGFGLDDYLRYAPETGAWVHLVWVAVRQDRCVWAHVDGDTPRQALRGQLDAGELARFDGRLRDLGLDPTEYVLVPCHPWQWQNKIAVTFAPQVAAREVVLLGEGTDAHQPQQSVRTFFNVDHPTRHYVKTALSVLNMGFMRGLSPAYMQVTPAINTWVDAVVGADGTLRAAGFTVLREVAAVGYRHPLYEQAGPSPYTKMLSALWRESPVGRLGAGERLATMASLLHVDDDGVPLVVEMVRASGRDPRDWVARYLDAYLVPVLHCFYAHGLVFMPHGENVILVLDDHTPTRVIMKDIGEEVAVFADGPLARRGAVPAEVSRVVTDLAREHQLLAVQSDVIDCFLRFLAGVLDEAGVLGADAFWAQVARCVHRYQDTHPELADRFTGHDLFTPTFPRMCMNRLQLRDNQQMVDLADPTSAIVLAEPLVNPLFPHRR